MSNNRDNGVDCCPECSSYAVGCTDSRSQNYGRRRRKKCEDCGHRFATVEIHKDRYDRQWGLAYKLTKAIRAIAQLTTKAEKDIERLLVEPVEDEDVES